MPRGELRKEVIGWLRFGHTKRRQRAQGKDRRGQIPEMVTSIIGHWKSMNGWFRDIGKAT